MPSKTSPFSRVMQWTQLELLICISLVVSSCTLPLVIWGAGVDPVEGVVRPGYFEFGYAFLVVSCALWLGILGYAVAMRKRHTADSPRVIELALHLYAVDNAVFGLAIGWDTSPWLPLAFFGGAVAGFALLGARPTVRCLVTGGVLLVAGIGAELLGYLPHAWVLMASPNPGDGQVWTLWHLLIGSNMLIVGVFLITMTHFVTSQWREREQQFRDQAELLRYMFGRYMSVEVMRTLLDNPDDALGLGGEQREVTLLMSDLRGFTALVEQMSPKETIALLNDYFERMVDVCLTYEGTINEIIGDALLVVFGAPTTSTDHADRAVACALAMQAQMAAVNAHNRSLDRPEIEMGIGINTGVVVVGNIGSSKRTKYGVVGSDVNLTARIESYTIGGQILVSDSVLEACSGTLDVTRTFRVHPKGGAPLALNDIRAIRGPFELEIAADEERLEPLEHPIPVTYLTLSGKHLDDAHTAGALVALSERSATLRSDAQLEVFDNIKLRLRDAPDAGDLYAKIIATDDDEDAALHTLRFTSVPPRVRAALRDLVTRGAASA